jgi:hypothetical protein
MISGTHQLRAHMQINMLNVYRNCWNILHVVVVHICKEDGRHKESHNGIDVDICNYVYTGPGATEKRWNQRKRTNTRGYSILGP